MNQLVKTKINETLNNNFLMNKFTFFIITIFLSFISKAQLAQNCTQSLLNLEQAYSEGKVNFILDSGQNVLFYNCLENNEFSSEERLRAQKLLTKTFIFNDNREKSEESLVNLLRKNKEYKLTSDDPAEFHYLYSIFRTTPIFRMSAKIGANKSYPIIINSIETLQETQKSYNSNINNGNFTTNLNFWGEILIERLVSKKFELATGIQLRNLVYVVEGVLITNTDPTSPPLLSYTLTNTNTMLRFPLMIKYNYRLKNLLFIYPFIGSTYDITLNSNYQQASRSGGTAFTLPEDGIQNNLLEFQQVSTNNVSVFGGIGVKTGIGRGVNFLTFEFRYDNSLFNYINPNNRWANQVVWNNIGHVEDDVLLNSLSFSIGYVYSIYSLKKHKKR